MRSRKMTAGVLEVSPGKALVGVWNRVLAVELEEYPCLA